MRKVICAFILAATFISLPVYFAIGQGSGSNTADITITATPGIPLPGGGGGGGYAPEPPKLNIYFEGSPILTSPHLTDLRLTNLVLISRDQIRFEIERFTLVNNPDGTPATQIFIDRKDSPPPPPNTKIVGNIWDFTPHGISFVPPAKLTLTFEPPKLPKETTSLVIAYYHPNKGWIELESETAGTPELGTVTAKITHTAMFALLAKLAPPTPATFTISSLNIKPKQAPVGTTIIISVIVSNIGGSTGSYNLELKINHRVEATKELTLTPGSSQKVDFPITKTIIGEYQVEIGDLKDKFTVVAPAPPPKPSWLIIGIAVINGFILLSLLALALRRRY